MSYMDFGRAMAAFTERTGATPGEVALVVVRMTDILDKTEYSLEEATSTLCRLAALGRSASQCIEELPVALNQLN